MHTGMGMRGLRGARGGSNSRGRTALTFLQTYGPNGETIPLPLDAAVPAISKVRMKEIRAFEKERNDGEAGERARVDSGVFVLPRLPGASMPPIPELGVPGARIRRAPRNANDDLVMMEALERKREVEREAEGKKCKRQEDEGPKSKR
jgi:hypothetical protein